MSVELDLNDLSIDDLITLQKNVDKAIASFEARRKKDAFEAAKKAAEEHGFKLNELFEEAPSKKPKAAMPPKYRNPDDPEQTWSGHGRRPQWFLDHVEKHGDASDIRIAA